MVSDEVLSGWGTGPRDFDSRPTECVCMRARVVMYVCTRRAPDRLQGDIMFVWILQGGMCYRRVRFGARAYRGVVED